MSLQLNDSTYSSFNYRQWLTLSRRDSPNAMLGARYRCEAGHGDYEFLLLIVISITALVGRPQFLKIPASFTDTAYAITSNNPTGKKPEVTASSYFGSGWHLETRVETSPWYCL